MINTGGFFKVGEESEIYFYLPHFRVNNISLLCLWRRAEKATVTSKKMALALELHFLDYVSMRNYFYYFHEIL